MTIVREKSRSGMKWLCRLRLGHKFTFFHVFDEQISGEEKTEDFSQSGEYRVHRNSSLSCVEGLYYAQKVLYAWIIAVCDIVFRFVYSWNNIVLCLVATVILIFVADDTEDGFRSQATLLEPDKNATRTYLFLEGSHAIRFLRYWRQKYLTDLISENIPYCLFDKCSNWDRFQLQINCVHLILMAVLVPLLRLLLSFDRCSCSLMWPCCADNSKFLLITQF